MIDGIAFDTVGDLGHRLLVTINAGSRSGVDAIDCTGGVHTITRRAPRVEGGIAVARATFGRFAGDVIAPSKASGHVFAITPECASRLVADSGFATETTSASRASRSSRHARLVAVGPAIANAEGHIAFALTR